MYRTIVAGTDGSSTAQQAVLHASELAAATGACLHVVTAYEAAPGPARADLHPAARADVLLEHCAMRLPAADLTVRLQARSGDAGEVLLSVASEVAADLLVLGSDSACAAGSLPGRVAAAATCPVLLVRTPRP